VIHVGSLSKLRRMVLCGNVSVHDAARRLRISRNTAARGLAGPEMVEPTYPKRVATVQLIGHFLTGPFFLFTAFAFFLRASICFGRYSSLST
jgi:hypothetical protein